jgi:hypothetical protein
VPVPNVFDVTDVHEGILVRSTQIYGTTRQLFNRKRSVAATPCIELLPFRSPATRPPEHLADKESFSPFKMVAMYTVAGRQVGSHVVCSPSLHLDAASQLRALKLLWLKLTETP